MTFATPAAIGKTKKSYATATGSLVASLPTSLPSTARLFRYFQKAKPRAPEPKLTGNRPARFHLTYRMEIAFVGRVFFKLHFRLKSNCGPYTWQPEGPFTAGATLPTRWLCG